MRTWQRSNRNRRGYTLLEILVAVAILATLLSLMGVVGSMAIKGTKKKSTQATVERAHAALAYFYATHGNQYPPETSETWPAPYDPAGVEFDRTLMPDQSVPAWKPGELDASDDRYVLDAWGHRLRYRKASPHRVLVWSCGPDGIDQTGADTAGRKVQAGDDITSAANNP
ncbi:MAG: type II secretion system protein [Planctomycetota bacterium]|nr:type II secretion system protein [Planctomycetota bacterium]